MCSYQHCCRSNCIGFSHDVSVSQTDAARGTPYEPVLTHCGALGAGGMIPCAIWPRPRASAPRKHTNSRTFCVACFYGEKALGLHHARSRLDHHLTAAQARRSRFVPVAIQGGVELEIQHRSHRDFWHRACAERSFGVPVAVAPAPRTLVEAPGPPAWFRLPFPTANTLERLNVRLERQGRRLASRWP